MRRVRKPRTSCGSSWLGRHERSSAAYLHKAEPSPPVTPAAEKRPPQRSKSGLHISQAKASPRPSRPKPKAPSDVHGKVGLRDSQILRRFSSLDLEESPVWKRQEVLISARVNRKDVSRFLDQLVQVRSLPFAEAARLINAPERRVPGFALQVARALNLDGSPVLQIDRNQACVTLNVPLLEEL